MKIFRFVDAHQQTKPAVLMPNGKRLDVSHLVTDYNELFFANGGIDALRERLNTAADKCPEVPINSPFAPCVARPSKLVECVTKSGQ